VSSIGRDYRRRLRVSELVGPLRSSIIGRSWPTLGHVGWSKQRTLLLARAVWLNSCGVRKLNARENAVSSSPYQSEALAEVKHVFTLDVGAAQPGYETSARRHGPFRGHKRWCIAAFLEARLIESGESGSKKEEERKHAILGGLRATLTDSKSKSCCLI
jgi:hypothetical protein